MSTEEPHGSRLGHAILPKRRPLWHCTSVDPSGTLAAVGGPAIPSRSPRQPPQVTEPARRRTDPPASPGPAQVLPPGLLAADLLRLQRVAGNAVVGRLVAAGGPTPTVQRDGLLTLAAGVKGEPGLPGVVKAGTPMYPAGRLTDSKVASTRTVAGETNAFFHELDDKHWYWVQIPVAQQGTPGAELDKEAARKAEQAAQAGTVALSGLVSAKNVRRGKLHHVAIGKKYPLFAGAGPKAADIEQGGLGDCYLLAALATIARTDPARIQYIVQDSDDDTATVRFFRATVSPPTTALHFAPSYVAVRKTVAVRGSNVGTGRAFARGAALWPALIEKAYAMWPHHSPRALPGGFTGTYEGIAGGTMAQAWSHLTGEPSQSLKVGKDADKESLWSAAITNAIQPYRVNAGDTLAKVATAYGVTVADLRQDNVDRLNRTANGMNDPGMSGQLLQRATTLGTVGQDDDLKANVVGISTLSIPLTSEDILGGHVPAMPGPDRTLWVNYLKGGGNAELNAIQTDMRRIKDATGATQGTTDVTPRTMLDEIFKKVTLSPPGEKAVRDYYKDVFEALPGESATNYSQEARQSFVAIRNALKEGKYVGVGTKEWGKGAGGGNAGEDVAAVPGLASNHAYQVVSTSPGAQHNLMTTMDRSWYVWLRNPWGTLGRYVNPHTHEVTTQAEGGLVKVEISDLRRYFNDISFHRPLGSGQL